MFDNKYAGIILILVNIHVIQIKLAVFQIVHLILGMNEKEIKITKVFEKLHKSPIQWRH